MKKHKKISISYLMNRLIRERSYLENWKELDKKFYKRKLKTKLSEVKTKNWSMNWSALKTMPVNSNKTFKI